MFTGIIEELGTISYLNKKGNSAEIKIVCNIVTHETKIGDSIAVNGVCLTVVSLFKDGFAADVSYETLNKSSIGIVKPSGKVNLERALTLNTRLGGHIVSGHVDCEGKIKSIENRDNSYSLKIGYDAKIQKFIAEKGSIAVDGISLTVADIKKDYFEVAVIPHTFENTNMKYKRISDTVNLEVDIISRYLDKLLKKQNDGSELESKLHFL